MREYTRRRWLLNVAAPAAGTLLAAPPPGGILDTHTHFYDPKRPKGVPWPPPDDRLLYRTVLPEEFRRMTAPMGVIGTIVVEASPWVDDNNWILDLAPENPVIQGLVGRLNPGQPGFSADLDKYSRNPLFLGIRLGGSALRNGLTEARFVDDLRILARSGLALDVLGGASTFAEVVRLTDRAPELRVVIDHLPFDGQAAESAFTELKARKSVYAKVSHVARKAGYRDRLDQVWDVFGAERVLYGSNWPVSEQIGPYREVLETVDDYFTAKGPGVRAGYFRENAKAAYRWVDKR